MKIERTFVGKDTFLTLFMPFIAAEIDRILERQEDIKYNKQLSYRGKLIVGIL